MSHPAIGIDLGTTYCAVATIDEFGKPRMLMNRDGSTLTPSAVQIGSDGHSVIVGEPAKNSAPFDPDRTLQYFKINMGSENWRAAIDGKQYSATEISAYLLKRLKEDAETELGQPISKAVITVPAYFSDAQRVATKQAAEIAKLEVLQLINEPTAAAIDYATETQPTVRASTIFVFDLGGGTLDATVLTLKSSGDQELVVKCTDGLHDLGGIHWDALIVDMVRRRFKDEHRLDLAEDKAAEADAEARAETAKKTLSAKAEAIVQVASGGKRVSFKVSRTELEAAASDLLTKCRDLVKDTLAAAEMSPSQIDVVLLVGGSTRMPMIHGLVREIFGKEPVASTRVDESVARGAAIVAQRLLYPAAGGANGSTPMKITDVSSHSLGTITYRSIDDPYNKIMIERFSVLPADYEATFCSLVDDQPAIKFVITEGESEVVKECAELGSVEIPIPPKQKAGYPVEVRYQYDRSGILIVTVRDQKTGERRQVTIESKLRMSEQEVRAATRNVTYASVE